MGSSGLRVSTVGLGTGSWGKEVSVDAAAAMAREFCSRGGTLIDVSSAYGGGQSEVMVAKALRGIPRSEIVLSSAGGIDPTKPVGHRVDASRRHLLAQLDRSLQSLRTDFLDLWSVAYWDPGVPVEEVVAVLEYAVDSGRVRYAGVRDYTGWQLALTSSEAGLPIVSVQNEYSLVVRGIEMDVVPAAEYLGIGIIAAAPLAHGALYGSRAAGGHPPAALQPYVSRRTDTISEALRTAAGGLGVNPAAVAQAWVRQRPAVASVIVGGREVEHIVSAVENASLVLPRAIERALTDISH